jgi:uncharacterized protein YneF (UPF0154 family)
MLVVVIIVGMVVGYFVGCYILDKWINDTSEEIENQELTKEK